MKYKKIVLPVVLLLSLIITIVFGNLNYNRKEQELIKMRESINVNISTNNVDEIKNQEESSGIQIENKKEEAIKSKIEEKNDSNDKQGNNNSVRAIKDQENKSNNP